MPNPLRLRTSLRLSRTVHRTSDWEQLSGRYPRRLLSLIEPTADGEKKREGGYQHIYVPAVWRKVRLPWGETFEVERFPQGATDPDTPLPKPVLPRSSLALSPSPIVNLTAKRAQLQRQQPSRRGQPLYSPDISPEILFSTATSLLRPVSRST